MYSNSPHPSDGRSNNHTRLTGIRKRLKSFGAAALLVFAAPGAAFDTAGNPPLSGTIAVWLFDEHPGLYPGSVLHDFGPNEYPLVLGRSGYIADGKFGGALQIREPRPIDLPIDGDSIRTGLTALDIPPGRTVQPMNWFNATFGALMTGGENHLRKEIGHANATATGLNLGSAFDWTVEFWAKIVRRTNEEGVVFEIGEGPRGENDHVTRLSLSPDGEGFIFINQPGGVHSQIPSDRTALMSGSGSWSHFAFVYDAAAGQLRHYVNGSLQPLPGKDAVRSLERGSEDYFTLGTDGLWGRPFPGKLDELRFSYGQVYRSNFDPPGSFADIYLEPRPRYTLKEGPPLLFSEERRGDPVVELGGRKHLFVDDAILEQAEHVTFRVNPPDLRECVIVVDGPFRKHMTVVEDEDGLIRLYNALQDDHLGVWVSRDGIHFEAPDLGPGRGNIVIPERVGTGTIIIDPNAPPEYRWKYIGAHHRRGIYAYTSPDGWNFTRHRQALLPFRSASQKDVYYDDQRQLYVGFHRTDLPRTPGGRTQREFVRTETDDVLQPWPFYPETEERRAEVAATKLLRKDMRPYFLDMGPLMPSRFGVEYPTGFAPDLSIDPVTMGVYNPKAMKYPWAPDTYVAFPILYFHYHPPGERGRVAHYATRGGGPTETQFAASRDGIHWTRYPRPTYAGIGRFDGTDIVQTFIAQGMVRRGDEIWQYVMGDADYHSAAGERKRVKKVYRLVQRLDGFVSVDTPYEKFGTIVTRPLRFEGNRLVLNINTDAHGYAQVALLDESGQPIPGYSFEDSVIVNGNFIETEMEWLERGKDVGALADRTVRVAFRMRGSKLYSMQFTP